MELKQLKQLLKVMRQNGVTHYKTSDLELNLSPSHLDPTHEVDPNEQNMLDDPMPSDPWQDMPDDMLTQEELSFLASGGKPQDLRKN